MALRGEAIPSTADRPDLDVVARSGRTDVATVFVARPHPDSDDLIELVDGLAPPLARADKWIVNVSTQVGCPVGCPYCDAGGGFRRNLTKDEILAQVRFVLDRHPGLAPTCRKLKVHFARMGDPALNDAVLAALRELPDVVESPGLWACVATVAPRGRDKWFEELRAVKDDLFPGRFQLQLSVNSTDEDARRRLIPVPHWGLPELARYGARFFEPGDRRVVLNFALSEGVPFDPGSLVRFFDPRVFAVKLTPLNPTERAREEGLTTVLRAAGAERTEAAVTALQAAGFDVVLSIGDPREDEVGSNCGQAVRVLAGAQR